MSPPERDPVVSFEDEPLILVDADDAIVGYETKSACHDGDGIRHRAFSVLLFDSDGRMLLQQRSPTKRLWPMIWSNACCSHPRKGEELMQAARRRMVEELGIEVPLRELFKFEYRARYGQVGSEHEICAVLVGRTDRTVSPNPNEIHDLKYVAAADLEAEFAARPDEYSPWLQLEWKRIRAEYMDEVERLWRDGA